MNKHTNILFHLERDVLPIDDMQECVSAFFALVKSASEDCLSSIKWFAEIQRGSVAIAAYPASDIESPEEIDQCLTAIREDLVLIRGGKAPDVLSDKTINHYRKLSKFALSNKDRPGLSDATISVTTPDAISNGPIEVVSFDTPIPRQVVHESFGTAYGKVKSLSGTGRPYVALYDETSKRRIKVFYQDWMLDSVKDSFLSDVRVTGDIVFNEDGSKRYINAAEIEILEAGPRKRFSDLFGILSAK